MSSSVYPYTFDAISRIGNDSVAIDQRNIQNTRYRSRSIPTATQLSTTTPKALLTPVSTNGHR